MSKAPENKPDLIVEIAHAIIAADHASESAERREMDANRSGAEMDANYYKSGHQAANEAFYGLQEVLPFLPAKSLDAAMVQLSQAVNLADWLVDLVQEEDQKKAQKLGANLHRLITSALRSIEAETGRDLHQLGLGRMRQAHRDPWVDPDEQLAFVRAKHGS